MVGDCLKSNTNVILPIRNSLILLDFLDIIYFKMKSFARHVYIFSEAALPIFKFSNSMINYITP